MLNHRVLDLEAIIAQPLLVKDTFKDKSKNWEAVNEGIVNIWIESERKFLIYKGIRFKVIYTDEELPR